MSSSTSETYQSEVSSQEDKNYLEQSKSSEEKKRRKSKNKKKDKQKKKQKSKNKNKHSKKNKHKQKAYNKHKHKHKHKNKKKEEKKKKKKEQKKKHSKNKKKITKLSQITQPVEKRIPKCQNCNKKQSQFYCTKCEVFYCSKCEEQIHNISVLKKHKKHLYKAPYNELVKKETNFNICRKHNKKLSLYCIHENKLICYECYETCKINNHEILGLTDFSNEIYEKIKIILNKIQNEENQNKETKQKSLENQNKLKEKIKNICKKIENDSDLLIQKIQDSKINYLNSFKKIEIIINNKIQTILKNTEKKQKMFLKKKIKINTIKKLKKDKNHIKLIQEGKEIIKSEINREKKGKKVKEEVKKQKSKKRKKGEKEKERKCEKKDEFDPKMDNAIKLINKNKTAWKLSIEYYGRICGKKIYSSGKHEIKIKIDQFPNSKNQSNEINLGVIKTENRENFIKYGYWEAYYFKTYWNKTKLQSRKRKRENGKWTKKIYPEEINLEKNDIFTIFLDMDQKKISFKINEKNLGGWENLPQKVNFFAELWSQKGKEKNQITII
ncbi:e3 ubiquitin-protein ligase trim [Anaeramoeba flamelloides]|uniref:E3 ubiquitin-protein ligase trim n=1 Tax=Anaeramoeba flamelloides TaxID=1746091 RepID=A0ABQ8XTY5_9EUKA|nr:e3 ubiquitin-protein ligase trim [Anaeramoeba flamelloides]